MQPRSEELIQARETKRNPVLGESAGIPRRPKPKWIKRKKARAIPTGTRNALTFSKGSPYKNAMPAQIRSGIHIRRSSIDKRRRIIFMFMDFSRTFYYS
jgi:hypothetical protein